MVPAIMSGDTFRRFGGGSIAVLSADRAQSQMHGDCFADEVVIDFPSVNEAIERMRRAFVDDLPAGAPLKAEISLSPRQAFEGATVPLDVPVRCTCSHCGGRGETWLDPCVQCAGTGTELRQHQVQVSVPGRVADGTRFRFLVVPRHDPPTHIELRVAVR